MKQGTNFVMDVQVGYDLDQVESIDFIFVQDQVRKIFHYPSSVAVRLEDTDTVQLAWTIDDTFEFSTKDYLKMDSHIILKDSIYNPSTTINLVRLAPTLFTKSELTT